MEIIYQNITAISILFVNLIVSISYFIIYSKDSLKNAFFKLPVILQKLYVAFFVIPLFTAPFFSVLKFTDTNIILLIIGIIISMDCHRDGSVDTEERNIRPIWPDVGL